MVETTDTGPLDEELIQVAVCREADDMRSMHKLIGAKVGADPWVYWDVEENAKPPSATESLLGACGFVGSASPRRVVRTLKEEDVNCVPLFGFTLPREKYPQVRMAIQVAMSGQLGGFIPLVASLAGFHDTAIDAFSYVWTQAGGPPIWVRTPELPVRGSGTGVPESLQPFAHLSTSIRNSRHLRRRR